MTPQVENDSSDEKQIAADKPKRQPPENGPSQTGKKSGKRRGNLPPKDQ